MDFPYRRAGRKSPDRPPVLIKAVAEEAAALAKRAGKLVLGGRSMGGRMCSMAVAEGLDAAGLVLIPIRDDPEVHRARAAAGWFPRRSRQAIVIYSVGVGFLGFGLGVAVQLLPLWYRLRFGVSEADLGPWYALGQIASLTTVALVPYLERRLGGPNTILAAL